MASVGVSARGVMAMVTPMLTLSMSGCWVHVGSAGVLARGSVGVVLTALASYGGATALARLVAYCLHPLTPVVIEEHMEGRLRIAVNIRLKPNLFGIHDDLQCHRSRQPVGSPFTQMSDINYDGSMGVVTDDERG